MKNIFNIKSFFKFLSKNISYTLIDIFGLSVSLLFVILIAVYVRQELSTDNFQEKKEHIYALSNGRGFGSAYKLAYRIEERCPEVEKVCPVTHFNHMVAGVNNVRMNADYLLVDTTFFDMFSFELTHGHRETVLAAKNYAVISESFANRAFPGEDPMGRSIQVDDSLSLTVNGIMKDIRNSVFKYCDVLFRIDNVAVFNSGISSEDFNNAGATIVFLQEAKGADIHRREGEVADYFREIFWQYQRGLYDKVFFVPFSDIYFSDYSGDYQLNQGSRSFVMILLSICILILVFAIINYINLTVAQTGFRAKEMAIRRLLGSERWELFLRLIIESTLLTFISFAVAVVLAFAFVPVANNLLQTQIYMADALTLPLIGLALAVVIIIGTVAGLLPAILISNSKPVDVVKGTFRTKTKMVFSKLFITFQNTITIVLIAVSITMIWQIQHLINAPLGYNTTAILEFEPPGQDKNEIRRLKNELERLAVVNQVAYAAGTPFNRGNNSMAIYNDMNFALQFLIGDSAYYDMFGLEIIFDNNLADTEGYYATEETYYTMGLPDDMQYIPIQNWNSPLPLAGKMRNIQLGNANSEKVPVFFQLSRSEDIEYVWSMLAQVRGDQQEAYSQVQEVYEQLTGLPFDGVYIDQRISASFTPEKRTSRIVMVFAFIAILISMLGLLAMSTYFIQQRAREIAVRKVFGSTNTSILKELVMTFLYYVVVAFVIACPIIWYIMSQWLSGFSYRITLSPLIFIAAGLFCLIISFVTVFVQSYDAANANPAESIKSE